LDQGFAECKLGKEQSPIDIQTKGVEKASLAPIKPAYTASAGELVNNGHTIQINLADGGTVNVPTGDYKVLQFHFHTPSEEKINGKNFPLVAHLVHKNAAGKLAVVAVLFKQGKENLALKDIFNALPAQEGKEALKANVDLSAVLPPTLGYYTFNGSLTTPPCSEGVAWHVLKTLVEISANQLKAFKKIFKMNARPVQPLNGRKIQESN
jgi:carbonic anhydrase